MPSDQRPKRKANYSQGKHLRNIVALIGNLNRCRDQNRTNQYDNNTKEDALVRHASRTAYATVIIAIASVLTFGAAVLQYLVFSGQLREMKSSGEQTDKIIKTNSQLASAAQTQADAANIGNRAWISPRYFSIDGEIKDKERISIRILYDNAGKTPALDVEFRAIIQIISRNDGGQLSSESYRNVKLGENNSCGAVVQSYSGVVYPASNQVGYASYFFHRRFDSSRKN